MNYSFKEELKALDIEEINNCKESLLEFKRRINSLSQSMSRLSHMLENLAQEVEGISQLMRQEDE